MHFRKRYTRIITSSYYIMQILFCRQWIRFKSISIRHRVWALLQRKARTFECLIPGRPTRSLHQMQCNQKTNEKPNSVANSWRGYLDKTELFMHDFSIQSRV